MNLTIDYYNRNAEEYCEKTLKIPMQSIYDRFESYLKPGDKLLDLGCGSGRDSMYFLSRGFDVLAVDGAMEICKIAEKNIGKKVRTIQFEELDYTNEFDAIWASASLLHVNRDGLDFVVERILLALRQGGVLYASWKSGTTDRSVDGKNYTDMTEKDVAELFVKFDVDVLETWVSCDLLSRGNEWINVIVKKF